MEVFSMGLLIACVSITNGPVPPEYKSHHLVYLGMEQNLLRILVPLTNPQKRVKVDAPLFTMIPNSLIPDLRKSSELNLHQRHKDLCLC
jgi:hypothetical protein